MTTPLWAIASIIFATTLGASASILMKKAAHDFSLNPFKLIRNIKLMAAIGLYGLSTVVYVILLKYGDLSVLYPFVATTYIWVALFSVRFLKEKMNRWKWIGIASIIVGVAFIGLGH